MIVLKHPLHRPESWHRPIQLVINVQISHMSQSEDNQYPNDIIAWKRVKQCHYDIYKERLKCSLQQMDVPEEAILCQDKCCVNKIAVDKYCANLIDMCINAGTESLPKSKGIKSISLIDVN